jgi:hypothetical protein
MGADRRMTPAGRSSLIRRTTYRIAYGGRWPTVAAPAAYSLNFCSGRVAKNGGRGYRLVTTGDDSRRRRPGPAAGPAPRRMTRVRNDGWRGRRDQDEIGADPAFVGPIFLRCCALRSRRSRTMSRTLRPPHTIRMRNPTQSEYPREKPERTISTMRNAAAMAGAASTTTLSHSSTPGV